MCEGTSRDFTVWSSFLWEPWPLPPTGDSLMLHSGGGANRGVGPRLSRVDTPSEHWPSCAILATSAFPSSVGSSPKASLCGTWRGRALRLSGLGLGALPPFPSSTHCFLVAGGSSASDSNSVAGEEVEAAVWAWDIAGDCIFLLFDARCFSCRGAPQHITYTHTHTYSTHTHTVHSHT